MNNNNIDNLKLYICNESYDYERVMKAFKGEQDLINKIQINQQNPNQSTKSKSINKIQDQSTKSKSYRTKIIYDIRYNY
ncbi:hypothetical protein MJ493_001435 [Campylobacter jejuni]|uniref:Uncharacterized protein n=1 Tax=Campylobacter jejuni TaxID=197 RepID=A0A3Z8TT71_CAMJU|nr:hypothetical protein [Campylobacter jejuni]EAC1988041.1 hypothetical protein [Campylobacter coli]EAB5294215.1 hypothetical protein [Campylobacter jejuni]EAC1439404.1 hypothetical protein [Campylobacter jejuni]EAH6954611.1 hypothetical protein [Campylobacter jejuni]EAH7415190.1 hypothetical protein [Campylobacter jejuni]